MKHTAVKIILLGTGSLIFLGAIGAIAASQPNDRSNSELDVAPTSALKIDSKSALYTVEQSPLAITLTGNGTIKSRDQHIVKSQVEGRTSIIYIIKEGSVVKEGDLLIELDSSSLQDRLVDQQIQVENSEADTVSASESLEVTKIQTQSNIAKAKLDNQFAIEDKLKYMEGEWPKQLMEAETDVTLKDEELRRTTDEFNWSQKLFEEMYLSETEFRADELAMKRAQLQLALSKENLNLLTEFTHKRRIAELDSEIEQKELALKRVERESSSDLVQAEARLRARQAELKRQKSKLEKIEDQISKTKIYAPANGMVVYATSSEFSWRGDSEPLSEGQEVREREELIHLPSAESMMVRMQVHESSLGKIQIGQPVNITIDAMPDRQFTGQVTRIAPLPDAQSVWMNPDLKVYDTDILIDGVHPDVRTGMSCKATILIDSYENTLSVPLQAVTGQGEDTMVYVVNGKNATPTQVVTGLDNNTVIRIIEGVNPGDRVMLTPPLTQSTNTVSAKEFKERSVQSKSNPGTSKAQQGQRSRPQSRPQGRP